MVKPSICYVAHYDPDYSRNTDTIRALRRAGARVEVVQGPRGGVFRSGRGRIRLAGVAALAAIATLWRCIDVAFRLLRCQVLVVGYFGQIDMLLLAPLAKALGRPIIFNPLVTLTDTLVEDRHLISSGSPLALVLRAIDRRALGLADLVLVDTSENGRYVEELGDLPTSSTMEFPVGVDERVFFPVEAGSAGSDDGLDVLFYGTFIPLHGVETIVQAAALLQTSCPSIRFEIIGTGQGYAATRQLAELLGVTNIIWRDWLPYNELGSRLRKADVALGIFDSGRKASRVIPNKVHQALASAIPVVTRESPAMAGLLTAGGSAMLVPPDDPVALAQALRTLAYEPELRVRIGSSGREAWEAYASNERLIALAQEALGRIGVSR